MSSSIHSEKKRRAKTACQFCRRRKIRCTQALPSCLNCQAYKEVCSYDTAPKRPRPSNSRIANLEARIKSLEKELREATNASRDVDSNSSSDYEDRPSPAYHGPASVLFDDTPDDKRSKRSPSVAAESGSLMGEAAAQSESCGPDFVDVSDCRRTA